MTHELCTLFDLAYLPQGVVLYRSLERVCPSFRLRVFCMDGPTKSVLERMELPRLQAIDLAQLERHDRELLAVKPDRTRVEYCWTATPAVCRYSLEREPELEMITYVDADLMFFSDPAPLFRELGSGSVLIVPHRYEPRWQGWERRGGIYNVQFVTFRNDERGRETLRSWRESCLEWCYNRVEDGKFGDQQYLDDWPERFSGVHVLEHPGGGLAPWNVNAHALALRDGSIFVDGRPLVFFHYQSLRLFRAPETLGGVLGPADARGRVDDPVPLVWSVNPEYQISAAQRALIWEPYVAELSRAIADVRRISPDYAECFTRRSARRAAYDVVRNAILRGARTSAPETSARAAGTARGRRG